jgi:DNA-binding NarL/FixJ family response regulator
LKGNPITQVFIADSQSHVRYALRLLFEQHEQFEISGEASNPESLLSQVCINPPGLILLDWNLPGLRHRQLIDALKRSLPETIILVTSANPQNQRHALTGGADGFILKNLPPDQFLLAISKAIHRVQIEQD